MSTGARCKHRRTIIKITMRWVFLVALFSYCFFCGCTTPKSEPFGEFIRSVNFTHMDNSRIEILPSQDLTKTLSVVEMEAVLAATSLGIESMLTAKGFAIVSEYKPEADFIVRAQWIDVHNNAEPVAMPTLQTNPDDFEVTRMRTDLPATPGGFKLVLEIADAHSGNVFWRAFTPPATILFKPNAQSAETSAMRLMENFPQRVEKDPNLPNLSMRPGEKPTVE
jgi:hypothetical protein